MSLRYQHEIVSSWFERGQALPEASFDRFIYTWIAFNAALSARYGRSGDRKKVNKFGVELAPHWPGWLAEDEGLREGAAELARRSPILEEPPWPNRTRRSTTVEADDPSTVMGGIYTVRNNLFHGSKEFDAIRDHVLVKTSSQILERIFLRSGLYDMAANPGRDLTEPIPVRGDQAASAS